MHGKTIGLIGGGGRIGRAVAKRAQGFSMRTLYWTPRRKPESEERAAGLEYVPYDKLLAESDFVSVHAPLNAETRHLVGERELRLMKPTAFLVNSSRGPIVDEKALVRALAERRIAGAGLDVYENEPQVEPELLSMKNVVLTPHLGSAVTRAARIHGECGGGQHHGGAGRPAAAELLESRDIQVTRFSLFVSRVRETRSGFDPFCSNEERATSHSFKRC